MANRSLQAKALKLRKQIRRLPKPYRAEYVRVGPTPNKEILVDTFARANAGQPAVFMRGTTSHKEAEERARHAYLEAMFPSFFGHQNNQPRADVIKRVHEMLKDVPLERHVVLERRKHYKLMMYFNAEHSKLFFVSVDLFKRTVSTSINYGNRDRAMDVYRRHNIMWKKPVYLDS